MSKVSGVVDLSQRNWRICARVVRGEPQADVARAYGISRQRVGQILRAPVRPPRVRRVVERKPRRMRVPRATPEQRAERRLIAKCARQLEMQAAMMAALTYQRTGRRPAGFDHLTLPDPFAPLVPYARAMTMLLSGVNDLFAASIRNGNATAPEVDSGAIMETQG